MKDLARWRRVVDTAPKMVESSLPAIGAGYPFASHFVEVHGSRMHYIDEPGDGSLTFLFLHGNPASSYLWRNVIPHVKPLGRAVAPDLIGMGQSGKPALAYTFLEHAAYLERFIEQAGLTQMVLVLQDWGGGLGFDYACRHPENVKGLVFMECLTTPRGWADLNATETVFFKVVRSRIGRWMIIRKNFWIERFVPMATIRRLAEEEMDWYRRPFRDEDSRTPVLQWPREMPLDGPSEPNFARMDAYGRWLRQTELPKLFLYAEPGMVVTRAIEGEIRANMRNLTAVSLGAGKHYLPEDHPHEIGAAIHAWARDAF
jgi:haloalkane dehalogenase